MLTSEGREPMPNEQEERSQFLTGQRREPHAYLGGRGNPCNGTHTKLVRERTIRITSQGMEPMHN